MPFLNSALGNMHYEVVGDGPAVVLIHGFTNFGLSWAQQVPLLVHSGYRVVLPDLHGHGLSQPAGRTTTVDDLAQGVLSLLEHLSIERAILCGLSLGGMVAQRIAIDRPNLVEALIVANSRATFAEPALVEAVAGWIRAFEQDDGPRKRLESTWPNLVNETFRQSAAGRASYATWLQALSTVSGASLANVARGMTSFDVRDALGAIRAPTLVISGEHDKLFPPNQAKEVAQGIANARFDVIPGAGHISCLDSPDQFNAQLLAFLQGRQ